MGLLPILINEVLKNSDDDKTKYSVLESDSSSKLKLNKSFCRWFFVVFENEWWNFTWPR